VQAKRLLGANRSEYRLVDAGTLRRGDVVLVEANDIIPIDGTVIEGAASVSEAAVTLCSGAAGRAEPVGPRRGAAGRTHVSCQRLGSSKQNSSLRPLLLMAAAWAGCNDPATLKSEASQRTLHRKII
jgi:high-affinity K+ transport system ATPase subunit B